MRQDADGAPVDVVETDVDITARRRTEDALRRAEHRYTNIFQAMAVSFWELDFTGVGAMLAQLQESGPSTTWGLISRRTRPSSGR
ncbi:MAG: hypothetical protein WDM85_03975 [Caulobacteraceae bacterium]